MSMLLYAVRIFNLHSLITEAGADPEIYFLLQTVTDNQIKKIDFVSY